MSPQPITFMSRTFTAALVIAGWGAIAAPVQAQQLDVPYVPTPQQVVDHMLEVADVTSEDYVIDLGSGDGRIVVTAAQKYGARAMGVDLNPVRIKEANANAEKAGVTDMVTFVEQDLFKTDIGQATVLTMYLLPSVNMELRPRILSELRPGTRVVSHAFDMRDWEPDQHDQVDGRNVYLWIVPAQVDGRWNVQDADGASFTVDLKQEFQTIEGTATINGQSVALQDTALRGPDISFVVEQDGTKKLFHGRVDGDRIEAADGDSAGEGQVVKNWQASRAS